MNRGLRVGIAGAAILAAAFAGYRFGAREPSSDATSLETHERVPSPPAAEAERKVLYWRHPDGEPDYAAEAKKTADGRDYVPVYDTEERDFKSAAPKPSAAAPGRAAAPSKTPLYYRNPMGLPDTSPVPKKDQMGMDYIPVYEGEDDDTSTVKLSTAKMQRAGVKTAVADLRHLSRPVRAPAVAKPDERTLVSVTLRADSFIEKLYVNETGQHVKKGEPLFRVYSPDMVRVQVDYRTSAGATGREERGALQRLQNLQLPEAVMDELRRTRDPVISFDWPSPATGVVMRKNAIEGSMVKAGEEVYRLVDLSNIWVIADIAEQDLALVHVGSSAKITFKALPNDTFEGRVTFILHELDTTTRTAKVRIEVPNLDHRIRHEMFADVEISAGEGEPQRLAVPRSALIDSGQRRIVLVAKGDGHFEPREVDVGVRGDDFVEIRKGLEAGERVVVSANFLIDAESNLKAALSAFSAPPAEQAPASPKEQP